MHARFWRTDGAKDMVISGVRFQHTHILTSLKFNTNQTCSPKIVQDELNGKAWRHYDAVFSNIS